MSSGHAAAADYPSQPLGLVVGFAAGDPTDTRARFIAERLGPALGQPVIVENRPGAASTFAANEVMSRPRDGE